MAGEEHGQRNEETVVNISEGPRAPATTRRSHTATNKPLSVELEGERRLAASSGETLTGGHTDVSAPSKGDEDGRDVPNDLQYALELVEECLEQKTYLREPTTS